MVKTGQLWSDYKLTDEDIRNEKYKSMIGLRKEWNNRGAFQYNFMEAIGLKSNHKLLDIGCGPLRAGTFFIRYLNKGNYFGFDYNKDFIKAAKYIINTKPSLASKNPTVSVQQNFNLISDKSDLCNYGIAFSVLNHCSDKEIRDFHQNIHKAMKLGGKIYVIQDNHLWFPEYFKEVNNTWVPRNLKTKLIVTNIISSLEAKEKYGFSFGKSFFIEYTIQV
jgi:SAM-dependent methyltransferase